MAIMAMKNYRISFTDERGDVTCHFDVQADNEVEAMHIGYRMPEANNRMYAEMSVEEIPDGPKQIGVEFLYRDTCIGRVFHGHVIIRANDEKQALDYYNANLKGKRFWFNTGKTEESGKCIRGKALDTYLAACPGYDADATTIASETMDAEQFYQYILDNFQVGGAAGRLIRNILDYIGRHCKDRKSQQEALEELLGDTIGLSKQELENVRF